MGNGLNGDYVSALQALLPPGAAWPRHPDANWTRVLKTFAQSLARVDDRAAQLLLEADPRTSTDLLEQWAELVGLPAYVTSDPLEKGRLIAVLFTLKGDASVAFWLRLGELLELELQVEEFSGLTCDGPCDDALYMDEPQVFDCQSPCDDFLRMEGWAFVWRLRQVSPAIEATEWSCTDACDAPLRSWGNSTLEWVVNRLKPAHTLALFAYELAPTALNLLTSGAWIYQPGLGTVVNAGGSMTLSLPGGTVAPWDAANGYLGPSAYMTTSATGEIILSARVAAISHTVTGYDNLGIGLESAARSKRYSILITGSGEVYAHAHHLNVNLASLPAGTLDRDGEGWLRIVQSAGHVLFQYGNGATQPESWTTLFDEVEATVLSTLHVMFRQVIAAEVTAVQGSLTDVFLTL